MYAEAAYVVATLMEDTLDKLDSVNIRRAMEEAGRSTITEQPP